MSAQRKKVMSLEKMQVYEIAFNMFIKLILVISGLVAFFWVLCVFVNADNNTSRIIYGALDTLLGGSIYKVYKHYFPYKE